MHPVLHVGRLEGLAHQIGVLMSFLQATSCKWRDLRPGTVGVNMGQYTWHIPNLLWLELFLQECCTCFCSLELPESKQPCRTHMQVTQRSLSFPLCYWSSCLLLQNKRSIFQWLQPRTKWQVDAILRLSWCQLSKVTFTNSMHSCLQLSSMQHQKILLMLRSPKILCADWSKLPPSCWYIFSATDSATRSAFATACHLETRIKMSAMWAMSYQTSAKTSHLVH